MFSNTRVRYTENIIVTIINRNFVHHLKIVKKYVDFFSHTPVISFWIFWSPLTLTKSPTSVNTWSEQTQFRKLPEGEQRDKNLGSYETVCRSSNFVISVPPHPVGFEILITCYSPWSLPSVLQGQPVREVESPIELHRLIVFRKRIFCRVRNDWFDLIGLPFRIFSCLLNFEFVVIKTEKKNEQFRITEFIEKRVW